jgi:hypothetical protein
VRALSDQAGAGARPGDRPPRIAIPAIEATLGRLHAGFDEINARLGARRDPLDRRVIDNLVAGYAFVDAAVADGLDLFAMGNLRHLLELNTIVLCGTNPDRRDAYAAHTEATERRFYEEHEGGVRDVVEWLAARADESPWSRAAGVYGRILTTPQLFIEGNHRTGALVASYLLLRDGLPPFVLSPENAPAYFDASAALKDIPKRGAATLFRLPGIRQRLADLLREHSDTRHLAG